MTTNMFIKKTTNDPLSEDSQLDLRWEGLGDKLTGTELAEALRGLPASIRARSYQNENTLNF